MSIRSKFIYFYHEYLMDQDLFLDMGQVTENSPWHREATVLIHTNMVVSEYLSRAGENWTSDHLVGAFAAAFHDVGKPAARHEKWSKERGNYRSFHGHGHISARLWEDFAVSNWKMLKEEFGLKPIDIYRVGWLCENHMPYKTKKPNKVQVLVRTTRELFPNFPTLETLVCADSWGRISDDHPEKKRDILKWREEFETVTLIKNEGPFIGTCYILIGPSGAGKSTFTKELDAEHFSWDALRLEWYTPQEAMGLQEIDRYHAAYEASIKDKDFNQKAARWFIDLITTTGSDVVVDNINVSTKRRTFFITEARNRGFKVVGVLFPIDEAALLRRQQVRRDKNIPEKAVLNHYNSLTLPHLGDFDEVWVLDSNLPK